MNARSTQAAWAIGVRPLMAAASGASASASGGAPSRSRGMMPWISTDPARLAADGLTMPSSAPAAWIRPCSIGTAP
jgi:hypothetical protein